MDPRVPTFPPASLADQKAAHPMTEHSNGSLDGIFVAPSTPSFADLIDLLGGNNTPTVTRRRDLISGLRRVVEALDRAPAQVPADPRWLQPRLARIAPAAIGVTPKTWQNAVSNARNAMFACNIVTKRQRRPEDLSPVWRELWEMVRASKDKSLLSSLPRFIFFLDRIGILPEDVSNDHANLYLEAVEQNEICKNPQAAYEGAVMGWNLAGDRISAWPRQRLNLPSRSKRVMLPEAEYAPSFISDVDRYLETRIRPDLLETGKTLRPIAASTATTYRYIVLRFASHIAGAGVSPTDISSLNALLQPAHVKQGLRQMLERNGGATNASISDTAGLLLTIATHLALPQETVRTLTQYKARLAVHDSGGMTDKNRDRLRVLRNPEILRRLLHLPEQIIARPVGKHRYKALRAREDAIAIGILL